MTNSVEKTLRAKIYAEGYCCMYGYLQLCHARKESVSNMADWIHIQKISIYKAYRKIKEGQTHCMQLRDCLNPIILELQKEKGP